MLATTRLPSPQEVVAHLPRGVDEIRTLNLGKRRKLDEFELGDCATAQGLTNMQPLLFPGVLLRDFDRPLVIDELNRCDIDKVIGPLFTVLSGQATTLPYRLDVGDPASAQYVILLG